MILKLVLMFHFILSYNSEFTFIAYKKLYLKDLENQKFQRNIRKKFHQKSVNLVNLK